MANIDYAHGFRPITHGARVRRYEVDVDNATRIGLYEPVKMEDDGCLARGAAGNTLIGVVVGIFNTDREPIKYLPTTTAGWLDVMDDPDALFVVQDDGSAVPTVAVLGANANIATGNCSTATGESIAEIAIDGATTTSSLQLRLIALWNDPANSWLIHSDIVVQINLHFYTATAGI